MTRRNRCLSAFTAAVLRSESCLSLNHSPDTPRTDTCRLARVYLCHRGIHRYNHVAMFFARPHNCIRVFHHHLPPPLPPPPLPPPLVEHHHGVVTRAAQLLPNMVPQLAEAFPRALPALLRILLFQSAY